MRTRIKICGVRDAETAAAAAEHGAQLAAEGFEIERGRVGPEPLRQGGGEGEAVHAPAYGAAAGKRKTPPLSRP